MFDLLIDNDLLRPRLVTCLLLSVSTFRVLRDLRDADIVLGLPWVDDWTMDKRRLSLCRASFYIVDATVVEIQVVDRRPECILIVVY
jgi:hypothetical protein